MKKYDDNLFEEIAEHSVENDSFYEDEANDFKNASMIREQHKLAIIEFLESNQLQDQLLNAKTLLINNESHLILSDDEMDQLEINLAKITEDKLRDPSHEVKERINQGETDFIPYQFIFGLSNEALLIIYKIGLNFFENQKIDEAIAIFILLVTLNPTIADFNYALGLAYQQKEEWKDAVVFHKLASNIDPVHVGARISLVECYQKLGNRVETDLYLKEISDIQEEHPELMNSWEKIFHALQND